MRVNMLVNTGSVYMCVNENIQEQVQLLIFKFLYLLNTNHPVIARYRSNPDIQSGSVSPGLLCRTSSQ